MSKKEKNFVIQATILSVSTIICRIIGMLYRSPLKNVITALGNGYYSTAYGIYLIILLISSYNIPLAISKLVAEQNSLGKHKNAQRIFRCSLVYVFIIGGIASILTYACAPLLVYDNPNATMALRVLAPTIFFSGILGAFRGYFQADGDMVKTSVSQIIEQIANAVISILAALILTNGIEKGSELLAKRGAAGGAFGTLAGVLTGILYMIIAFLLSKKRTNKNICEDNSTPDSYKSIFKLILIIVTPIIFTAFICNISTTVNMLVYYRIMKIKGIAENLYSTYYGVFSGEFVVLINVPIGIAASIANAIVPRISASYANRDLEQTTKKTNEAISLSMLIGVPAAAGLCSLAYPIIGSLFWQAETIDMSARFLIYGSAVAAFTSFSTVVISVLQAIGKVNKPVKNAIITIVIDLVILFLLLWFTDLGIYALLITMIVQSLILCITNFISLKKCIGYKLQTKETIVYPFIASAIMGVISYCVYKLTYILIPSYIICLIIAGCVGIAVYFITIIKIGGVKKEALLSLPKGEIIAKLATKLKLLK